MSNFLVPLYFLSDVYLAYLESVLMGFNKHQASSELGATKHTTSFTTHTHDATRQFGLDRLVEISVNRITSKITSKNKKGHTFLR